MINIEDILEMWKRDAEIEEMNLDDSSRKTPMLHAKYLELLTTTKLMLRRKEMTQKTLLLDKWKYYSGQLTKDEMDEKGWDYDPFKGASKPLKSDMSYYYEADPELQKSQATIEYLQECITTLESIMTNLTWRHQTIKNMIEWRKFTSGG